MTARKAPIEAEPARRMAPAGDADVLEAVDEAGQGSGVVETKTRLPIWLHLALQATAARNGRSLSGELMVAAREHVEREAAR